MEKEKGGRNYAQRNASSCGLERPSLCVPLLHTQSACLKVLDLLCAVNLLLIQLSRIYNYFNYSIQ